MKSYWRKAAALAACAVMGFSLFGCTQEESEAAAETEAVQEAAQESAESSASGNKNSGSQNKGGSGDAGSSKNTGSAAAQAPTQTDFTDTDRKDTWGMNAVHISLNGSSAECSAPDVSISSGEITISREGTYLISGTLDDGQLIVEAGTEEDVQLVLNGASITNQNGAAIVAKAADKIVLTLAPGTDNTVTDGTDYADTAEDAPNAAIYSAPDLSINGSGSLTVNANYNNGISTKDDLVILDSTLTVTAENHGLKGNDSVAIGSGTFKIQAGGDGIQADKTDDPEKGWIIIDNGSFDITAGNDGIQAVTGLTIHDGEFDITTNGGSGNGTGSSDNGNGFSSSRRGKNGTFGSFDGEYGNFDDAYSNFGGRGGRGGQFPENAEFGGPDEDGTGDGSLAPDTADGPRGTRPSRPGYSGMQPDGMTGATENAKTFTSVMLSGAPDSSAEAPQVSEPRVFADAETRKEETGVPSDSQAASSSAGRDQNRTRPADARWGSSASTTTSSGTSSSYKGLKSDAVLFVDGGTFNLNCADDAVHANGDMLLEKGTFTIASGDDAVHADGALVTKADITITTSSEGIEGGTVTVDGGTLSVKSSDDGINASGSSRNGNSLTVNDGTIQVEAGGDGLDTNGDLTINGGNVTVIINSSADNGGADCDGTFTVNGGNVVYGGTGTGVAPDRGSTQSYVFTTGIFKAGEKISVRSGLMEIMSTELPADAASLVISAPGITAGSTYDVYAGSEQIASVTAGEGGNTGMGVGGFGGADRSIPAENTGTPLPADGQDTGDTGRPSRQKPGTADASADAGQASSEKVQPESTSPGSAEQTPAA